MTTHSVEALLTDKQREVAGAALELQAERRQHVVIALSGAHAYGFPSPDSDLDLKAIHIAPTRSMLGLAASEQSADLLETTQGVEIDYTSNELGAALRGILAGNGNYIERVLGALIMQSSPQHEGLRAICQGALSRLVHRHYRGFALNQYRAVTSAASPAAKRILYVLRTALTGTHLLRTGELTVNVNDLLDEYGHSAAAALIEAKRSGENTLLEGTAKAQWAGSLDRALADLDGALASSCLPAEPANRAEADAWLVEARLAQL